MMRSLLVLIFTLMSVSSAAAQQVVELLSATKHPSRATTARGTQRSAGGSRSAYLFDTAVIFPHLAVGQGTNEQWETLFVIVNLSVNSAQFNLGFFDKTGAPMTVTFGTSKDAAAATESYLTATLPAEGSMTIKVRNDGQPLRTGFAILEPPSSSQRLGGYAVFRQTVPGRPQFEAVVPLCDYDDWTFYMPFDNTSGLATGMALLNPSDSKDATVSLMFLGENGELLLETSLPLKWGEQTSFSLQDKYPSLAGKRGTLYAESSTDYLSALGLRFNIGGGGAFTSLPVMNWADMYPQ
ncbi:hypothetical protein EG829_24165 [bacterium]|nr:hypothetical protein [bacterium]